MSSIGGPNVVDDGLVLSLDAGNPLSYPGSGTSWTDLSGNGKNFNWVSNPTFTSAGALSYFSTLNNLCIGPASNSFGINNTSGYTIFLISEQITLTGSASFKFYKNNLTGSAGRGISIHCAFSNGIVYLDQGGCCNSDTRLEVDSGGSQSWNVWTFRRFTNSSTRTISKNSVTIATNTASAQNIDLDERSVNLGGSDEFGGNSSTWNAKINGFFVYNRGLSDIEIQQNYNALKGRFGL